MAEYVMGIDFGTESVRVGIFRPDGTPVIYRTESYSLCHPRPGWAEQSPDEWWAALAGAVRAAMEDGGISPDAIAGIGTDTTSCTVLALDKENRPLRPVILWMDLRAAGQSHRIAQSGHPALKYNGYGAVSAEWLPCKALWIKENEPEIWRQAVRICDFPDWLTYKLTGRWTASVDTASIRCYHDRNVGGWQGDFFARIGLEDLLDKLPTEVLDMGVPVGPLCRDAAEHLGLREGTPVAEGGADAFIAQIGLGVVAPGKTAFITGSSTLMLGQSDKPLHAPGIWGSYTDAVMPGQYTVEGGQASAGSIMKWFKDHFCGAWQADARCSGRNVYDILNEEAARIPIGSEGLIILDHWQGNRSPYTDPESRGVMWGFSLRHTPSHVARAVMEGVAFGIEQILRTFSKNGYQVEELVACGGEVNSPLWMQIHADVSNMPITITRVPEAATLGSAILAAVGANLFPSVTAAAEAMVHPVRRVTPNQAAHEEYRFYYERYAETYPAMKDILHKVVRHVAEGK